jgi:hypothetical protein
MRVVAGVLSGLAFVLGALLLATMAGGSRFQETRPSSPR